MEGLREGQGNESLEPAEVERVVGFVMQAIAGDVRRIAAAMVLKRDDELLGPGEFDLREKMLQAASHILEATLDDRKKGGTKAAARSAHTAARTPASSSGEPKGW